MATKDERPTLLSKVAMFVRNPTKDWSELDRPQHEEESGYDKQALKAMIERKRQNDFVRRREFDQLRKLRSRDASAVAALGRPSLFQSSHAARQHHCRGAQTGCPGGCQDAFRFTRRNHLAIVGPLCHNGGP